MVHTLRTLRFLWLCTEKGSYPRLEWIIYAGSIYFSYGPLVLDSTINGSQIAGGLPLSHWQSWLWKNNNVELPLYICWALGSWIFMGWLEWTWQSTSPAKSMESLMLILNGIMVLCILAMHSSCARSVDIVLAVYSMHGITAIIWSMVDLNDK